MTSLKDLQTVYEYGYWANTRLFAVVSQLTSEQFIQPVAFGGYGSVRNTLVHMLSAEWGWLDRCGGAKRGPALVPSNYPSITSIAERWRQVETDVRAFLSRLNDGDLGRIVEFELGNGPRQAMRLGELMHHAAVHGIHHRGQVALLFRSLGQAPGNLDILFYYGRNEPE